MMMVYIRLCTYIYIYISPRGTHIGTSLLPIINGGVRPRTISETNSRIRVYIIYYIEYIYYYYYYYCEQLETRVDDELRL